MELRMFSGATKRTMVAAVLAALALVLSDAAAVRAASDPHKVFQTSLGGDLAAAIAADDAVAVRRLVNRGARLSEHGQQDITLLQWAMVTNQTDMVKLLLELGADPTQRGLNQQTALHMAVMAKGRRYLKLMLDHGADPNTRGGRTETPVLSEALMNGNTEALALLLAHRADPNATDRQGETPLHVAAQINDYSSMLKLLEAGADATIRNKAGQTFAAYFAIHPNESMMSSEALAARRSVQLWLDNHGPR